MDSYMVCSPCIFLYVSIKHFASADRETWGLPKVCLFCCRVRTLPISRGRPHVQVRIGNLHTFVKSFNGWFCRFVHTQCCNTYPFTFHLQWKSWRDRHANTTSTFRSDLHFHIGPTPWNPGAKWKWVLKHGTLSSFKSGSWRNKTNPILQKGSFTSTVQLRCVNFIVPIETPIEGYVWGVIFPNPSHRKRKHNLAYTRLAQFSQHKSHPQI